MARNFSDVFRSDENESENSSDFNTDQNAEGSLDASNEGINIQNESYSRDGDGEESYDSTGIDTGGSDLGLSGSLDNMVDSLTNSSSSSDSNELLD